MSSEEISKLVWFTSSKLEVFTQRYWVFGLCPSSGFFLNNNEKHNVSETGTVSILR
jgi:hypothetical protein